MQAELVAHLAELLYEHDKVALPGLGTFFVKRQPGRRDPVQGVFLPPSREVQFNPNLLFDDGLLAKALANRRGLSMAQAVRQVEDFVAEARRILQQKETLELDAIGKLFSNLNGQIQFVSAEANFDPATYGLPAVKADPITTPPPSDRTGPAVPTPARPTWSSRMYRWFSRNVALLLFLTFLALAAGAYIAFGDKLFPGGPVAEDQPGEEAVKPIPVPQDDAGPLPDTSFAGVAEVDDDMDSDGITPEPGQNYFIIGVGMFREEENVNNAIQKIYADGYEPYIEKKGRLTQVGIQKAYSSSLEIQAALDYARSEFDPRAFIIKR